MIKIQPKLNNYYFPNINFKANPYPEVLSEKQKNIDTSFLGIFSDKLGAMKVLPSQSKVQSIAPECFFIRMQGYGKNYDWANKMVEAALGISDKVKNKSKFGQILNYTCEEVAKINGSESFGKRRAFGSGITIFEDKGRGREYFPKYAEKLSKTHGIFRPENDYGYHIPYTSTVYEVGSKSSGGGHHITIQYGCNHDIYAYGNNLELCKRAYDELISNDNPTVKDVLETCATIQWLIAQECPFKKGNDSIANLLTKGIMHCYGLTISPVKEGCSLDFEAFCTDLDDYIKKYPTFFEKYPIKI